MQSAKCCIKRLTHDTILVHLIMVGPIIENCYDVWVIFKSPIYQALEMMFYVQMRPLWTWEVLAIHKLPRGTISPSSHRTLSRNVCATCPSSKWWGFSLAWTNSGRNLSRWEGFWSNKDTAIISNHLLGSSCMKWHFRRISYSKHIHWSTKVSVGSKRLICGSVNPDMLVSGTMAGWSPRVMGIWWPASGHRISWWQIYSLHSTCGIPFFQPRHTRWNYNHQKCATSNRPTWWMLTWQWIRNRRPPPSR